jgi:lipopolysaccharide transport system ATP-binding protein
MELSGRDNVYLNGSFLGMKRSEISRKFDEIIDFSGVEQFIDTPVKYYSSGMFVRLAFSVAVNLTPETLLLDEVLSVGDAEFQHKSFSKMKELISSGSTIVFVSHNETAVKTICKRAIWLQNGELVMDGDSTAVVNEYMQTVG